MRIILVNPPLTSVAVAPLALQRTLAALAGLESLEPWDANLAFWQQRLLTGPALAAAQVLRGEGFYDPAAYVAARRALDARLAEPRQGPDLEDALAQWAAPELASRIPAGEDCLALLVLDRPGQWPGALGLGEWLKTHRPACAVALVGDCMESAGAPAGPGPAWDHALPLRDPAPLRALVAELTGRRPGEDPALAEPAPLPGGYLLPAPVPGLEPERSGWRAQGAAGFLLLDRELPAARLAGLAPRLPGPDLPLGLAASLEDPTDHELLAALARGGVRLLQWQAPAAGLAETQAALTAAARAGLWNHLVLPSEDPESLDEELLEFIGANPSVAHSWSRPAPWPWSPRPSQAGAEPRARAYSQVAPLPGRPLWRIMAEPAHLLLYLARHGREAVLRWRARGDGRVYTLGANLRYVFDKPERIGPGRLEEIARLVLDAGKVKPHWLRHNLSHAYVVGYAEEEGVIVGTDTLKRPRDEYIARIKEQSGVDLTGYTERGYISVRPEYRTLGVGSRLIQGIIGRAEGRKMVIITGADNLPAQRVLARNSQRLVRTYHSQRLGKDMQIWMPGEQDPELGEEPWP